MAKINEVIELLEEFAPHDSQEDCACLGAGDMGSLYTFCSTFL